MGFFICYITPEEKERRKIKENNKDKDTCVGKNAFCLNMYFPYHSPLSTKTRI